MTSQQAQDLAERMSKALDAKFSTDVAHIVIVLEKGDEAGDGIGLASTASLEAAEEVMLQSARVIRQIIDARDGSDT